MKKKSHSSQLSSGDTHYNRKYYHRKHPARTRRPCDVPWMSSKGSNVKDLKRTLRRLSGNQYKTWWFYEKYFSEVMVLVLLQKEQLFKSFKWGRPRDVYGTQLLDVHRTKWWIVSRTLVGRWSKKFFKLSSQKH